MKLIGQGRSAGFRGGHGLDVRGLLPLEQIVPGGGTDGHPPIEARRAYPRVVKSVRCMPAVPPTRTFRSFQGVVTAPATVSAPARASRLAVASLSATLNAMRTGPETRLPTSLRSIISACSSLTSSRVARPASRTTIFASPSETVSTSRSSSTSPILTGTLPLTDRGAPAGAEITPVEPDPVSTGEGRVLVPRCLTIAGSDSGGGAGIQADLKAFAAAGCYGMTAIVALTAQNTVGVTAVQELPPAFVEAQLQAVFDDIGVDSAKTGMLFSLELIDT